MTQSTYSWCGSQLHLVLDDEFADNYNKAVTAFLTAQIVHQTKTGSPWTVSDPLDLIWTEDQRHAYNKFADLINLLIEINGGTLAITEEQMSTDLLVKL